MTLTQSQNHRRWALFHIYDNNKHGLRFHLTTEANAGMYLRGENDPL